MWNVTKFLLIFCVPSQLLHLSLTWRNLRRINKHLTILNTLHNQNTHHCNLYMSSIEIQSTQQYAALSVIISLPSFFFLFLSKFHDFQLLSNLEL